MACCKYLRDFHSDAVYCQGLISVSCLIRSLQELVYVNVNSMRKLANRLIILGGEHLPLSFVHPVNRSASTNEGRNHEEVNYVLQVEN